MAERLGDIALQCSGGTPGSTVSSSLTILLPANITNRVNPDSTAPDVQLTINGVAGPIGHVSSGSISFNSFSSVVPSNGTVNLRISNLRLNVNQLGLQPGLSVQARIAVNPPGGILLDTTVVTVGSLGRGLLASYASTGIHCSGSPYPSTVGVSGLFAAGTRFFSTRLTEGFATAFQPRDSTSDTGTRFLVRYSGLPAGTHLFVPDAVAGSSAAQSTGGGDLGVAASGGQFVSGSSGLLLVRVLYADVNGAGGTTAALSELGGSGTQVLDSASEVPVLNGSASVVYEVVSANPQLQESAQFPTFLAISDVTTNAIAQEQVSLAPVSTAGGGTAQDPIPRFVALSPDSDCSVVGDCGGSYFPKFVVSAQPIVFTTVVGGPVTGQAGYIAVQNQGGGVMSWTASVTYQSGSGWITLDQTSGVNNGSVRPVPHPQSLVPGTYQASVVIDAGSLGTKTVPISLTVAAAPAPSVLVGSVVNAATFAAGPLAPGALATVTGTNLSGKNVSVTFDGVAASLLYKGPSQINLRVPTELAGRSSSQMIVTVDGNSSAAQPVSLTALSPGIFGILNQDNSLNGPSAPAPPGSILQVFATGLPAAGVIVKILARDNLAPVYAGALQGVPGVEQVNVTIPDGLAATSGTLSLCAYGPDGQKVCSPPAKLALRQ